MDMEFAKPSPRRYLWGYGLGLVAGILATVLAICLFALVMTIGAIPDSLADFFAMLALWLGSFFCGFLSLLKIRSSGLIHGAVAGVLFFLLYTIVCLIFQTGGFWSPMLFLHIVVTVAAAIAGGVIAVNLVR